MTDKQKFDHAMRGVLSVTKDEMRRRIEAENKRTKIGAKRGPKPSASRASVSSVQN